jgi:hypothetical protein
MNAFTQFRAKFRTRQFLWCDNAILVYFALATLLIHLLTSIGYGYFGDELYWLDMSSHLDFGYVDVPPLAAYLDALSGFLVGTSLFAIHILPAIVGAVTVYFAGLTARELGGGRFAQGFSAMAVLVAPYILFIDSVFTYDCFDQLFATILFYLVVRIINRETPKTWLLLGIIAGLGVMTKLTMIYTCGALAVSLLFTSKRKSLLTVWPWQALLIAALISTPYLVWQSVHGWPLLAYFQNYAVNSIRPHPQPLQFFTGLGFFDLNPILLPVWLLGLVFTLFHKAGKKYRLLGFTFLLLAVFYTGLNNLEPRQIVPACLPLFAAGAVWLEKMISAAVMHRKIIYWVRGVYIGVILVCTILMAPINLQILPEPVMEKYWSATPAIIREADFQDGIIPQHERFSVGWPELVEEVASVYNSLPEVDRKKCMIWTGFYWDAGAIDFFGRKYGLPAANSNNSTYQIWGTDQFNSGEVPEVAIMINTSPGFFPAYNYFGDVTLVKSFTISKYSVYKDSYLQIYICRSPVSNFLEAWKNNMYFF